MALRPLHHRRNRDAEPLRDHATALAHRRGRYDTLAKIIGKGSRHPMLASCPASILNHNPSKLGILPIPQKREPL